MERSICRQIDRIARYRQIRQIDMARSAGSAAHQGLGPAGIEPTKPQIRDQVHNKRPGPAQNPENK